VSYSTYWSYYGADLLRQLGQHFEVVALATLLGSIIGISLGVAVYRVPRASQIALRVCGVLLTVPSLALYVLLLSVIGLGWPPVLTALTLYSLLPIVQNTVVGLSGVDSSIVEAATGIGMPRATRVVRVELPMAWPIILTGVRTSALLLVSTATIGAIVRGPGLGNSIYDGLNRIGTPSALYAAATGIAGVAIVGITLNFAFLLIAKLTTSRGIRD
jgi:osmoprotectant transport system permease protein